MMFLLAEEAYKDLDSFEEALQVWVRRDWNKWSEEQRIRSPWHADTEYDSKIYLDYEAAWQVIDYIETLTLSAGAEAGRPFVLRPWQKELLVRMYAPKWVADGRRVVRQCVFTVARKNGKTELISGIVLAHLHGPLANINQQLYSAAADRFQAALVYRAMKAMILLDDELQEDVKYADTHKTVQHPASNSFYQALSADANTKHGFNPTIVVYDELAQAPNRELYDVLTTALGAQAEPLTLVISTQSPDPNHPMSELVDYGRMVANGEVDDPTVLLICYETPDDDDPWDEDNWYKANPALGDFRSLEEMRTFAKRAQKLPPLEATFRNLYLNQRVDSVTAFISRSAWQACGQRPVTNNYADRLWWAGLDLSQKNDLTALVLVSPDPDSPDPEKPIFDVLPFFWVPGESLREKEFMDKVPYTTWHRDGYIETRNRAAVIDYAWVAHKLVGLVSDGYNIQNVGFDRWRIDDFLKELEELEIFHIEMTPHGQGYKDMNPAVEVVEDLVTEERIRHGNHPVLTWNAACCVVESDPAGNRKFAKNKSKGRIDGMVALAMALRCAVLGDTYASIYETNSRDGGFLVL